MDSGYIKIHRRIINWEWYDDINTKVLFLHLLFTCNWQDKKWHGIEIKRGEKLTSIGKLAMETKLSVQQTRTALINLQSTHDITSKTTNQYTIVRLINYDKYQSQITSDSTDEQQTDNKRITTTKELKELKELKEESIRTRDFLRKIVGLDEFKDRDEMKFARECYILMEKVGEEEFNYRLKTILSDSFKAKNCTKLEFLYGEIKSFIHSPIVQKTENVHNSY